MVSLEKKTPEERLNICRKYYLGGFAFLPLLWFINAIWFYKQAFKVEPYPEQTQIRKYVIRSAIGTFVWILIILVWNIMFQVFRTKMGPAGDYLTFVVPPNKTRIRDAYKRLIILNHPDRGGSPYVAAKINEAKDYFESGAK
ncbi:unnamed protein product [Adineta steineri]|uniref:Gamma-secretase subunit PEN-2 n=1 Tax=Adineta steineri TaxID=433720 RepID=A0A815IU18_9BILA|nr:unnamed protein product [Adineta steineri]